MLVNLIQQLFEQLSIVIMVFQMPAPMILVQLIVSTVYYANGVLRRDQMKIGCAPVWSDLYALYDTFNPKHYAKSFM